MIIYQIFILKICNFDTSNSLNINSNDILSEYNTISMIKNFDNNNNEDLTNLKNENINNKDKIDYLDNDYEDENRKELLLKNMLNYNGLGEENLNINIDIDELIKSSVVDFNKIDYTNEDYEFFN